MLLSKVLSQLAYPLASALVLIAAGIVLRGRWPRLGIVCAVSGLLWLWLCSLPVVSNELCATLEQRYAQREPTAYPVADAIVVLGGGMEGRRAGWRARPNLTAAADRVWFGAQLFHAGRAPRVVLSGGVAEWSASDQPESEAMADFLVDLGVPRSAMLLEPDSLTTHENALRTHELLATQGLHRVLLVTSALHMRRAMASFAAAGIEAIAAPTDVEAVPPRRSTVLDWLPDAQALEASSRAIKEYLGLLAYQLRGWTVVDAPAPLDREAAPEARR